MTVTNDHLTNVRISLRREVSYNFNTQIKAMRWLKDIMTRECARLEALCDSKPDGTQSDWPKEDIDETTIARAMSMVASEIQNSLLADVVRTGSRAGAVSEVIQMLK